MNSIVLQSPFIVIKSYFLCPFFFGGLLTADSSNLSSNIFYQINFIKLILSNQFHLHFLSRKYIMQIQQIFTLCNESPFTACIDLSKSTILVYQVVFCVSCNSKNYYGNVYTTMHFHFSFCTVFPFLQHKRLSPLQRGPKTLNTNKCVICITIARDIFSNSKPL